MSFVSLKERQAFEAVVEAVRQQYSIDRATLVESRIRSHNVIRPRQLAYYCLREYAHMTFPAIADLFRKDHTTVIHGCRVVEKAGLQEEAKALWALSTPTAPGGDKPGKSSK